MSPSGLQVVAGEYHCEIRGINGRVLQYEAGASSVFVAAGLYRQLRSDVPLATRAWAGLAVFCAGEGIALGNGFRGVVPLGVVGRRR